MDMEDIKATEKSMHSMNKYICFVSRINRRNFM